MAEPSDDDMTRSTQESGSLGEQRTPGMAMALGAGGLLPFVVCAAAIWAGWRPPFALDPGAALLGYAAVILSFLGGARWGLALRIDAHSAQSHALAASVVPSIAAWLSLLFPVAYGLSAMTGLFMLLGVADARLPLHGAPVWYALLRKRLTFAVVPLLAVATLGMFRAG